ncbi:MAG: hypothetical protein SWC96_13250, partial [Thermodesulfobacteriota bacterium]|nr:hypothetical protein [Thermodesulfobacteriota bacterium]
MASGTDDETRHPFHFGGAYTRHPFFFNRSAGQGSVPALSPPGGLTPVRAEIFSLSFCPARINRFCCVLGLGRASFVSGGLKMYQNRRDKNVQGEDAIHRVFSGESHFCQSFTTSF